MLVGVGLLWHREKKHFQDPQKRMRSGGEIYSLSKVKRVPLQCPISVRPIMENQGWK